MNGEPVIHMDLHAPAEATAELWPRFRGPLLILAALGIVGCLAGLLISPRQILFAYLTAYLYVLTLVLGMLFFVMLHHVTDAGWSVVVRRSAEQALAALPWLAVLFLPVLAGTLSGELYNWVGEHSPLVEAKWPFLTVWFFLVRAGLYFCVWLLLMRIMRGKSIEQDQGGDKQLTLQMRRWSGPGLILYAATFTFASIDWIMTLKYKWFSTIFGVYVWSGSVVGSLALTILLVLWLRQGPLNGLVGGGHLNDLGRLLFAFCVFWAYIAFSQYFLIWYANIPEETNWYLDRWHAASWRGLSILLPLGHFVVPFFVLMHASAKRSVPVLLSTSILLLVMHYLDLYWMVMPTVDETGVRLTYLWIDMAALCFLVGLVGLVIVRAISRHRAYPVRDPRLSESLACGNGHDEAAAVTPAAE